MPAFNIHQAKTQLSKLIAKVEAGEEVIIQRNGKPVAKLVRISRSKPATFGFAKGTIKVQGEITDPMPDDWLDMFYNAPLRTNDDFYDRALDGKRSPKPRKSTRAAS